MLNLPAPRTGENPGTTAPRTSCSPKSKSPGALVGPGGVTKPRDHVTLSHMMSHIERLFKDKPPHYSS